VVVTLVYLVIAFVLPVVPANCLRLSIVQQYSFYRIRNINNIFLRRSISAFVCDFLGNYQLLLRIKWEVLCLQCKQVYGK